MPKIYQVCAADSCSPEDVLRDARLVSSNSEANRMIEQGAVRINGERVTNRDLVIAVNADLVLQVGKRRYKRIRLVPKD